MISLGHSQRNCSRPLSISSLIPSLSCRRCSPNAPFARLEMLTAVRELDRSRVQSGRQTDMPSGEVFLGLGKLDVGLASDDVSFNAGIDREGLA